MQPPRRKSYLYTQMQSEAIPDLLQSDSLPSSKLRTGPRHRTLLLASPDAEDEVGRDTQPILDGSSSGAFGPPVVDYGRASLAIPRALTAKKFPRCQPTNTRKLTTSSLRHQNPVSWQLAMQGTLNGDVDDVNWGAVMCLMPLAMGQRG